MAKQANPAIATRVRPEFKQKLTAYLKQRGIGLAAWLEEAFQGQLDTVRAVEEAYTRGLADASFELAELFLEDPERWQAIFGSLCLLVEREWDRKGVSKANKRAISTNNYRPF